MSRPRPSAASGLNWPNWTARGAASGQLNHSAAVKLQKCSNICVVKTRFEWDPTKAADNLRKHGVSFQTAARVFTDRYALVELDRIENGEERWHTIGLVEGVLMLIVAHTVREQDDLEVIRIISARHANRRERRRYEEENG
jgi:uncharacterized DUF497 family protein